MSLYDEVVRRPTMHIIEGDDKLSIVAWVCKHIRIDEMTDETLFEAEEVFNVVASNITFYANKRRKALNGA